MTRSSGDPPRDSSAPSGRFGRRADHSYRLIHQRTGATLASHVRVAASVWSRMKGLLGRSGLPATEALVLPWCRSIHTVGMRFAIDAVFVDRAWRVVAVQANLRPGRVMLPVWSAWGVVEFASGVASHADVSVGDQLRLEEPSPCSQRDRP